MLKLFNKTGNHFVENGYLLVIGLHDIACHKAVSLWTAAHKMKRGYINLLRRRYARSDQSTNSLSTEWSRPVAAQFNSFHTWMTAEWDRK